MKQLPHIAAKVFHEPWLITPEKHRAIQQVITSRLTEQAIPVVEIDEAKEESEPIIDGKQCVIPVFGIIGKRLSAFEMMCGGCDVDRVIGWLEEAEENPDISEIILHFDSPGGTITGIPEAAERIAACNKTVIAFTDTEMCSGAYYLAAGADQIICTASCRLGSIGVYTIYEDHSRALANKGVEINAISSGRDKLLGAWWKPLTDDERAKIQSRVSQIHAEFKAHVSEYRDAEPDCMEGGIYDGKQAVLNRLADSVVSSMQEILR